MKNWRDIFIVSDGIATYVQSIGGLITSRYCVESGATKIALSIVWNGYNSQQRGIEYECPICNSFYLYASFWKLQRDYTYRYGGVGFVCHCGCALGSCFVGVTTMCNNCTHRPVCYIYRATGGVKNCEHFKEEKKAVEEIDFDYGAED